MTAARAIDPRIVLDAGIVQGAGGGIENTLITGARYHEPAGYRSIVALVHPPRDTGFETLRTRAIVSGVRLYDRGEAIPVSLSTVAWFARLCRRHRVGIWHSHDYKTDVIGRLLQPWLGFSLVCTLHGWSERTMRTRLYFALDRLAIRGYHHVVAVSSDLHTLARRIGVPEARLTLIENGVDCDVYSSHHPKRGLASTCHIGAAGRLTPEKGFANLIAATERLLDEGLDVRLSIAGAGPDEHALRKRVNASRYPGRLTLRGFLGDMRGFYDELDVFCLSSLREGLPNVVLEAMAMRCPVVATSVGGLSTFLRHDADALLCPPGSPTALADALRSAICSPELRLRLADQARRRVEANGSLGRRMSRLFAVYERLR